MAFGDAIVSKLFGDVIEFRMRDYTAEAKAHSLARVPTDAHPLSSSHAFSLQIADSIIGRRKASDKSSSAHLDELEDPQADEGVKFVTQQEYIARLIDMKSEIAQAWHADDQVKSLKLTVKVARLLRDTALLQFYPTLFSLVTDILSMLGDMVWERIKRKAEFSEDGFQIHSLREDIGSSDVCSDAKETCRNWFCKIGSIRELLPRIYLELAILPCWRFLSDDLVDILPRLVAMIRGLGDPLASAYCHLYLAYCAQKLAPHENGDPRYGILYFPKTLLSLVKSWSSWMTTRLKVRTLCAIISSLAASAQTKLLYNVHGMVEASGNSRFFFDDPLYHEELASFCHCVLQNMLHAIREEDSPVARGNLALDACNCIATFLKMNDNTLAVCKELVEIAQSSSRQDKYLGSTLEFLAVVAK